MKRIDLRLVELGLAPTRSKAQQMIRAGEVEVRTPAGWVLTTDVSRKADQARVLDGGSTLRYVSRGGLKLAHALDHLNFEVLGVRVMDVGLSTGGFADCVLQRGAAAVLGIDVGHDQLHPSLKTDQRLTSIEGLHIKDLADDARAGAWRRDGIGLVVADLSFISLTLVIPHLTRVVHAGTPALILVKPQFETDATRLNRRGIVADVGVHDAVEARVTAALREHDFDPRAYFAAEPRGRDGNQEFFSFSVRV